MNTTVEQIGSVRHLDDETEFLIARAAALGARRANRALEPLGLKVRSYSVLALAAGDRPPSQRMLADYLQLDPSQIVALVDELEGRDLVRRENDPGDRRVKVIVATDAGRALAVAGSHATRSAEDEALSMLDATERAQLVALLRKVALGD